MSAKDAPQESDYGITAYYLGLMVLLGLTMWTVPQASLSAIGQ
ncbi:MAG TPA: hypothetical protein VM009_04120 [Terriglobales bacterium]|nr:hypothetical protein [Terriglobales bacterium]